MSEEKKKVSPIGIIAIVIAVALIALAIVWGVISLKTASRISCTQDSITLEEDKQYTSKEDVSAYVFKYKHLPSNYVTKMEAQLAGWIGGPLNEYLPGKLIGGDKFYVRFSNSGLPQAPGRYYRECDVNDDGKGDRKRERLVFSNDGYVYYTKDHYNTFELVYEGYDG